MVGSESSGGSVAGSRTTFCTLLVFAGACWDEAGDAVTEAVSVCGSGRAVNGGLTLVVCCTVLSAVLSWSLIDMMRGECHGEAVSACRGTVQGCCVLRLMAALVHMWSSGEPHKLQRALEREEMWRQHGYKYIQDSNVQY